MITAATPRLPLHGADGLPPLVRRARPHDAPALYALSLAFIRSGALRPRSIDHYLAHAGEFLLTTGRGRTSALGCLALSDEGDGAAVLYNFCVARGNQGQGLGAALLRAALAEARHRLVREVFTATTSGAAFFRRHGFVPPHPGRAPATWAAALDPARGSEVLSRRL
ncbi:amino-acid N-acetyltransferase [Streptomyces sp. CG 926]|uniref:GNAT family N-acetyltransferase n=1 Tax=Streptomyces sp. CG 926 TaxID=1882405 RepID=UPI000D7B42BA|nr:GNAT family N-acetyltransferase [Streptomyces sp. CG 926]PWK63365.1 amino-acid N-acetyltransferase [Streptomyces sp. CG 926]